MKRVDVYQLSVVITDIVEQQHKLNKILCGPNYLETLHTDKGRPLKFNVAMFDESTEVLNCTPWKHWKDVNEEMDTTNLKLEIADLWFFIASVVKLCDHYLKEFGKDTKAVDILISNMTLGKFDLDVIMNRYKDEYKIQGTLEDLLMEISALARAINNISLFNPMLKDTFANECKDNKIMIVYNVLTNVARIANIVEDINFITLDANIKDIMETYTFKAVLNEFRANNGYAEGTYAKMWSYENETLEDNYVAKKLFDQNPKISIKDFYDKLETTYKAFQ